MEHASGGQYSSKSPFVVFCYPSCLARRKLNQELLLQDWFLVFESGLLELWKGEGCYRSDDQRQDVLVYHENWLLIFNESSGRKNYVGRGGYVTVYASYVAARRY